MVAKILDGVALISGAASGIGLETALSFAEAGAQAVIFADINESGARGGAEKSKALATNPRYRSLVLKFDLADPASVQSLVEDAVKEFGRIDYAVNGAGIGTHVSENIAEISVEEFDKLHTIDNRGTLLFVRAVSQAMLKQDSRTIASRNGTRDIGRGSIINVASANSLVAVAGQTAYTTAKHAIIGITKTAGKSTHSLAYL
ncbi:MAG: hypothetical protein Q9227_004620 [Pyrenula ochraceoflavens]